MKIKILTAVISIFLLSSCSNQFKMIENTFDGNIELKGKNNPSGEFNGNNSNGTYSFYWNNNKDFANADIDIEVSKGSARLIIIDSKQVEVFNTELTSKGINSFSGITNKGTPGEWQVVLHFKDFNGEGSFSVERGQD